MRSRNLQLLRLLFKKKTKKFKHFRVKYNLKMNKFSIKVLKIRKLMYKAMLQLMKIYLIQTIKLIIMSIFKNIVKINAAISNI